MRNGSMGEKNVTHDVCWFYALCTRQNNHIKILTIVLKPIGLSTLFIMSIAQPTLLGHAKTSLVRARHGSTNKVRVEVCRIVCSV